MERKRILIVDDEVELVEALRDRLQRKNYEVLTAYDGQEALDAAHKEKPDLIILDLMLPRVDGYKVCGLLKADIRYNKIPIIMFTAKGEDEDIRLGKEIGADAYITKSPEDDTLLSKIGALLSVDVEPAVEL